MTTKSIETISQIDAAILVISKNTFGEFEHQLISAFQNYDIDFIIIHNKEDEEDFYYFIK